MGTTYGVMRITDRYVHTSHFILGMYRATYYTRNMYYQYCLIVVLTFLLSVICYTCMGKVSVDVTCIHT